MIRIYKYTVLILVFTASVLTSFAQSNNSSPYSRFGVGDLKGPFLPQNRAMGGIAYGISRFGGYNNINPANPASYAYLRLTAFDVGLYANVQKLSNTSISEQSVNGSLNHLNLAIPVTKKSALSIGLMPFSTYGYAFINQSTIDTINVNNLYTGEGGLSRAFLGYGLKITKNISFGINANYIFGDILESRSAEFPEEGTFLNTRTTNSNSIGGLNFDYGLLYTASLGKKTNLTLGYTGSAKKELNQRKSTLATRYVLNSIEGSESRLDTTFFRDDVKGNVILPNTHNIGFSIERVNKWLIGADFKYAQWSQYRDNGVAQGLNDVYGVAVGGQYTPDINAVGKYLNVIDYRLGVTYDRTYARVNGSDITSKSITAGFGFPLVANRSAFYKINFAAEIGQRGSTANRLVKENFFNFVLGFTINDQWFQKYKYD